MRPIQRIQLVAERTGRWACWLALAMAITTLIVVLLRYGFRVGSIPLQESVLYMHAALVLLGLSFTMKHDSHVRVDIVYSRLDQRQRSWINLIGHAVFLLPVCFAVIWFSLPYASNSWRVLEQSVEVSGLPAVFLLKSLIPLSASLLAIQAFAEALKHAANLRRRSDA
ncbi:MAG: TRAP transporter small permease subunit [Pseudomonadales bacterium]|nr:TRAP transporter small permease subunit [Pseudomonadales bacterium]